jgi:hypothetical protein
MAREERVLAAEMCAHPDSDGFLTGRQVRKSGHLTRGRESLHLLFESADAAKPPIQALPVGHGRCGRVGHGSYLTLGAAS